MNGQGCTTPTLSNYMLERLRLKCPSKGHHLVMKVIANRFFSFFFPKSISSPITQGTINPPITVHLLFHVVIYVFLPSSIAWQWLYGRSSDLFMSVISNVGYIEEDGPDIGTLSRRVILILFHHPFLICQNPKPLNLPRKKLFQQCYHIFPLLICPCCRSQGLDHSNTF